MLNRRRSRAEGFTLLGVIIATAIVVIVVGALAALAVRSSRTTRLTRERMVATFLTREGIELVRSIRDDNWFAFRDSGNDEEPRCLTEPCEIFWRGGNPNTDHPPTKDICDGTWRIDATNVALVATAPAADDTVLTQSGLVFAHDPAGTPTRYRRWVDIAGAPCPPSSYLSNSDPPPPPFVVTSTVEWMAPEGGRRRVSLAEELFPWLRLR